MNRRVLVPLALIGLCSLVPACRPRGHAGVTASTELERVRRAQRERLDALLRRDVAALGPVLDDSLTYVHSNGEMENKAQFLETIRTGRIAYDSIVPTDVRARLLGDGSVAVVGGRAVLRVTAAGQRVALVVRFTDVYERRGGAWREVAWQSTRLGAGG
ncbi:MAG TPA: nuclear transport factor 2 family protein [Gemmatimonadaceae bacterium]|nr:nuclear transport factor 2 family protein [Gemmatimonadaceae bacterium]